MTSVPRLVQLSAVCFIQGVTWGKLRIVSMCIQGGGFYSAIASYFNSDCNPNTVRINMGRKMFLVATRNIKKGKSYLRILLSPLFSLGEEVTENYCAVFSELGVSARKQFLRVGVNCFPFHSC